MADCPGVLTLAHMADGGLARLRAPGGSLSAGQLRAVADAADRLGSGVVDLTNRANLQIRGLALDGGPAFAATLTQAGFRFAGEADRRRNILLDPFSALDPDEIVDLRPAAAALDEAILGAPWIGGLSPKFSFVLDGGGRARVSAAPSDVAIVATREGFVVSAGSVAAQAATIEEAVSAAIAVARAAAEAGPAVRAARLAEETLAAAFARLSPFASEARTPVGPTPLLGVVPTRIAGEAAVSIPVPVGRLDSAMLRFLAESAETDGMGAATLAPWSAVVIPGVWLERAEALLARSEAAGFTPVRIAERLHVTACAGAGACERAQEPAKALGRAVLARATARPELLPEGSARLHLSACAKGCAGTSPADLLLLGDEFSPGWSLHPGGSPRAPGPSTGRLASPGPDAVLRLLTGRG